MAVIRGVRHALLETIFPTTELLLYINVMFIVEMMCVFPAAYVPKRIYRSSPFSYQTQPVLNTLFTMLLNQKVLRKHCKLQGSLKVGIVFVFF